MNDVCITTLNICNSNKDNGNLDDVAKGNPQWGEDGVVIELMNITITIEHGEKEDHANDMEQRGHKYYVEQPMGQVATPKVGTTYGGNGLLVNLVKPIQEP